MKVDKMYKLDEGYINEIKSEIVNLLSRYIKIDTTNPPGDTSHAINFFKEIFDLEGINYKIYECSHEKKSILAWVESKKKIGKPLLLLNHIDVVPADSKEWAFKPFSGDIIDGYVCGRGALDMKGMAIAQLMSLIISKRRGFELKRDLMFLAVADEESGGFLGAKFIVDNYFCEINPEVVLDEGGFGFRIGDEKSAFLVSCSQKKSLWLRIRALGCSGHGSQPSRENPNNILLNALLRLSTYKWPVEHDSNGRLLYKYLVDKSGTGIEFYNTLVSETLTITTLTSGDTVNVIPSVAEATVDCRLLPRTNVDHVLEGFKKVINDNRIEIEVIKRTDEVDISDSNSEFLKKMEEVLKSNFKKTKLIPFITPVGTDSKYFRQKGVSAYGLFPILVSSEDFKMVHGANEKISIDNLILSTRIIFEIALNYCV